MAEAPSRVIAEATDYASLVEAFRVRAAQLNITRLEADEAAGLPSGYTSKLLAHPPMRIFGRISLGSLLGALALKLVVVEDAGQLQKIEKRIAHKQPRAGQSLGPRARAATAVGV